MSIPNYILVYLADLIIWAQRDKCPFPRKDESFYRSMMTALHVLKLIDVLFVVYDYVNDNE